MINLQLTQEDARFLFTQLERQLARMGDELIHTDTRERKRELARDVDHVRGVIGQLSSAMRQEMDEAALLSAEAP